MHNAPIGGVVVPPIFLKYLHMFIKIIIYILDIHIEAKLNKEVMPASDIILTTKRIIAMIVKRLSLRFELNAKSMLNCDIITVSVLNIIDYTCTLLLKEILAVVVD